MAQLKYFFFSDFWKLNSSRPAQSLNKSSRKSQKAEEQTKEYCFGTCCEDTEQVDRYNFDTLLWFVESWWGESCCLRTDANSKHVFQIVFCGKNLSLIFSSSLSPPHPPQRCLSSEKHEFVELLSATDCAQTLMVSLRSKLSRLVWKQDMLENAFEELAI